MKIIPLSKIDAQRFSITLQDKAYSFRLLDRGMAGVFLDVFQEQDALITGILCLDRVRLIRSAYRLFPGDLMFVDQQGTLSPDFTRFGDRFLLYYLTPDELDVGA